MLDLKFIRENPDLVKRGLKAKGVQVDLEHILKLDEERRALITEIDGLRKQINKANDTITRMIKDKKDPKEKIAAMKGVSRKADDLETRLKSVGDQLQPALMSIPNLPHESVPVGGADKNREVRRWGEMKAFDFPLKDHVELAESLDIIDFKRAAKVAGSNFVVYKKDGARLERALFAFMLDYHAREHGYTEILPPYLVNRAAMTGTGQLPKMEEDMYRLRDDDLFLIPTAEVPVTNLHSREVISQELLPVKYAAYTACFRREAGSYGRDTRGLVRVHQFDKVELVKFVKPENSYDELESLVGDAEKILQVLGLPYRVVCLASGDLSFAAAKCYDLEAYAPGIDQWLEVSSCSIFGDFQARRAGIRFKGKDAQKPAFVHTLNGSGLALARTVIAILENYQRADGTVDIPAVLRPYLGGQERIEP